MRLVVHDWGVGGPAVGPAPPRARRAPGRDQRRSAAARLPLAPRRPRCGGCAGVGEVAIGLATRWAWRRALPPARGRRVLAALRPGHPARDPAALPREPGGRARPRRPRPRAHRLPGARRVGRSRPLPPRARSPTPTPARSAARPRSCTWRTPGTGPGSIGRMSSIASPRSWTPSGRSRRGRWPPWSRRVYLVLAPAERGPRGPGLPRRPSAWCCGTTAGTAAITCPATACSSRRWRRCSARGSSGR